MSFPNNLIFHVLEKKADLKTSSEKKDLTNVFFHYDSIKASEQAKHIPRKKGKKKKIAPCFSQGCIGLSKAEPIFRNGLPFTLQHAKAFLA